MLNIGSGNRTEWEFEYQAAKLAEGAKSQKAFRESRVAFWTEAQEKVMAEVRDSGIEISESAGAGGGYTNSLSAPKMVIRTDLQQKMTECHTKIQAHQNAVAEYDAWVQVLEANPLAMLKLTCEDWLYFFGKPQ